MDINDRFKENLKLKKRRLLDSLIVNEILKDKRLIKAFMDVPLEKFIPDKFINIVKLYEDVPNLFYYDEQNPTSYRTISAPHMITIMLQGLSLTENDDLLILGAKSGYIAALAHKLAPKGEIIILEANSEIAKFTSENLKRLKLDDNISIIVKNPLNGMPELSPWQKILVTGAIEQSKIKSLLSQLDENGGVLFAPIGQEFIQMYTQILRQDNQYYGKKKLQVKFSPLITKVELDELELITDLEDYIVPDGASKANDTLNQFSKNIKIKYTSNILEYIRSEPGFKIESIDEEQQKLVLTNLNSIESFIKNLKKEEDIDKCFNYVEKVEVMLEDLKKYKKLFQVKIKRMQNILNQIRSYNIVRKELEKKDLSDTEIIDKKIELINKQIEQINIFLEILKDDIHRVKSLY
ncbi:MAG: protein-L-isoaspartate O-methyltransferase [Candidatus Thorarchaeota archaeon]